MSKEGLYEVFQSVLQVHGFAAVPSGSVIKIVPDATAQQGAIPIEARGREGDQMVTQVIAVEHVAAAALVPVLKPLIQGQVAAYAPSNVLIVSDRAANIARLEQIIRRVDLDDSSEIEVFRLRNAAANEVARVVNSLMGTNPQARGRRGDETVVTADERTNSIFISGDSAARLKIRGLVAHLDTPLENEGNTQVVFLKYAKAADMAVLLQSMLEPQAAGGEAKTAAKGIRLVQADEYNNALIISAGPDIARELKAVIRQLDIRRAQVLVEAVIAEVSTDLSRQLGVQFAVGDQDGSSPVAVSNLGTGGDSLSSIASAIINETYSIGSGAILGFADVDGKGLDWAVLVNALAGDAATNILSTPTLLATDNQEAQIVVGQNVPFVTGSYTTGGDSGTINNPFQTIERQDVGITLKVTPQINEGNSIHLDLEQEVSSLAASSVSTADVVTSKRAIKTSVTVEDGQIIVLGGLIEDTYTDSQQKVPLLGDLPALGQLFRYDSSTKVKKNLMVFLRTVILNDPELASSYSGQKYSLLRSRQFETEAHKRGLAKDDEARLPVRLEDLFDRPVQQPATPAVSEPPKAESGWGVDWE
jgi:general secretion pathway protein D